jgi:NAD(P)-dependent dehydrogenase (short-subunit alcohol dehydrogenase family)
MGAELVVQLAAEGCSVATCDIRMAAVEETARRAAQEAPAGTKVTAHECDVADEASVERFRDEVLAQHARDHVNLLFNNAGIAGGGSFILAKREEWERTFAIDWGGVYNCSRAFVPLLVKSDAGHLINTSSVNGFWASLGPGIAHTAYSTAKFAVKGFSEALIEDFRINAPHVKVSVVMPGHIGTDIVVNSRIAHGGSPPDEMTPAEIEEYRNELIGLGFPMDQVDDAGLRSIIKGMGEQFRALAPLTPAEAATIILNGVRAEKWRILVGDDAHLLDEKVRADPENAYGADGLSLATILGVAGGGG